jgi:superfamily II DNA helicase RecQ
MPTTTAQLLTINGIGRTKQEKYGDAVLELLAEHSS